MVEDFSDELAAYLANAGFQVYSESQKNNKEHGRVETKPTHTSTVQGISPLPIKTIAKAAGLGFMGNNNLFITEQFGCAITLGAVLTNAPFDTYKGTEHIFDCGTCTVCADICPVGAINRRTWDASVGRDGMLDICKCRVCMRCIIECPFTKAYAKRSSAE